MTRGHRHRSESRRSRVAARQSRRSRWASCSRRRAEAAPFATTRITDGNGRATTGAVPGLPVGVYTVQAFFAHGGPTHRSCRSTADAIYGPSSSVGRALTITDAHRLQHYGPDRVLRSVVGEVPGSTPSQRAAELATVQQQALLLSPPAGTPSVAKKSQINAWKNTVNALQNGGWITTAQQAQLSALADTLPV